MDRIQLDRPGLVPQFSGKLTNAHIWSAQVMVYHFSYLTYVKLMIITRQEDPLAGKEAFEICAATFGVKIQRYLVDN